mgnify:CR=1 FL=1
MDRVRIPKERMDYTIDLLIAMTVEEIAEETGQDPESVLLDFLRSDTGKALYDPETRFWWNGPSYIAEVYLGEVANRKRGSQEKG